MGMMDGLKSWFKRSFGKKEQPMLNAGNTINTRASMGIQFASGKAIKDFTECVGEYTNPLGEKTKIYMARVSFENDKNLAGYPITFELPAHMDLQYTLDSGGIEYLLNSKNINTGKNSERMPQHLGGLTIVQENNHPYWYVHDSTQNVLNDVRTNISEPIYQEWLRQHPPETVVKSKGETIIQPDSKVHNDVVIPKFVAAGKREYIQNGDRTVEMGFKASNGSKLVTDLCIQDASRPAIITHRDGRRDYVYTAFRSLQNSFDEATMFGNGKLVQFSLPCDIETMYEWANETTIGQDGKMVPTENAIAISTMLGDLFDPNNNQIPKRGDFIGGIKVSPETGALVYSDYAEVSQMCDLLTQKRSQNKESQQRQTSIDELQL